mgnify:CR=1 FL=1
MDMDNEQSSPSNLVKWPFFASAVFILGFVLYFALNRPPDEPLDQWQLATCVLSSALACILIFLPYLLEKFLELALNPSADREEQLIQKIYFELKELRDDLGKLGVKVEKVPALVDKIVSESSGNDDAAFSEAVKLGGELEALRKEIGERFDGLRKPLEDAAAPQPDVALSTIPDAIEDLRSRIEESLAVVQASEPAKRKTSRKKENEPAEDRPAAEPEPLGEGEPQTEVELESETPEEEPSSAEGDEIPQEPEEEAVSAPVEKYLGLGNFSYVLGDPKFHKALKNTALYVLATIAIALPLAFFLAHFLRQVPGRIRPVLSFLLLLPGLCLSGVLATLFQLFFHGQDNHV